MSYSHSGSVATLWSPSNYSGTTKMPVPSTRRYSSNATTASYRTTPSTDRYASSTASYTASRSTQSEYRSRYTAPIRSSTSVPSSYSRLADIHETSSRITSKDRSETNDSNVIGYSRSNKTTDNDVSYSWSKVDGYKLRNDAIPSRFLNSSVTLDSKLLNQRKLGGTSLDFSSKYNGSSAVGKGKTTVGSRLRRKDSLTKSENADSTSPSPVRSVERKSSSAVGGSSSPIEIRKNSEENRGHLGSSPRFGLGASRSAGGEKGGLNGLRNIGNTCFMNSVIQCLSNTKPLLEYLLNEEYLSDINTTISGMKGALIKAFSNVIQELWAPNAEDKIVNTTNFKSQIQRFAPRFMGYSQQDAQEFLRYLLEGLHEDVNRVTVKPKPITTDIDDTLSDSQKAAEAWKRYLRMDDSKIVDIFVGQLKSTLQCTVCGHCSVTFDPFWDLSLPVPSRTGQLKLTTCLDAFTKEEVLDGDEKPTCSKCKTRRKCTKSFSIQKFPKILVLHLKRFSPTERFRGKLSITVDFPCVGLDLSPYAAAKGQGCTYNLYAISNHSGTTYSGHYTAYCKHPYTGNWHEYNDSRVSGLSSRSVVSGEAYVLFYELTTQTSHL